LDTPGVERGVKTRLITGSGAESDMGTTMIFKPMAIQKKTLLAFWRLQVRQDYSLSDGDNLPGVAVCWKPSFDLPLPGEVRSSGAAGDCGCLGLRIENSLYN
jgi:hypothetical protein